MTSTLRVVGLAVLCLTLAAQSRGGPLQAETVGKSVLPEPRSSWFLMHGSDASHIFDAADGQMQGLISHTPYTTAIVTLPSRKEAYFVDSFYSRGVRGERSDVLTVVDMSNLTPAAEIDIPDKAAALRIRQHIGLLDDERHVVVFNMTPGQSVSIVDVVDRQFVGEISTPGCAIIMPSGPRGFLMLCGDGTLQLILLDENGAETDRVRTKPFFVVEEDAVFDRVVRTSARLDVDLARGPGPGSQRRRARPSRSARPGRCSAPRNSRRARMRRSSGGRAASSRSRCTAARACSIR